MRKGFCKPESQHSQVQFLGELLAVLMELCSHFNTGRKCYPNCSKSDCRDACVKDSIRYQLKHMGVEREDVWWWCLVFQHVELCFVEILGFGLWQGHTFIMKYQSVG